MTPLELDFCSITTVARGSVGEDPERSPAADADATTPDHSAVRTFSSPLSHPTMSINATAG